MAAAAAAAGGTPPRGALLGFGSRGSGGGLGCMSEGRRTLPEEWHAPAHAEGQQAPVESDQAFLEGRRAPPAVLSHPSSSSAPPAEQDLAAPSMSVPSPVAAPPPPAHHSHSSAVAAAVAAVAAAAAATAAPSPSLPPSSAAAAILHPGLLYCGAGVPDASIGVTYNQLLTLIGTNLAKVVAVVEGPSFNAPLESPGLSPLLLSLGGHSSSPVGMQQQPGQEDRAGGRGLGGCSSVDVAAWTTVEGGGPTGTPAAGTGAGAAVGLDSTPGAASSEMHPRDLVSCLFPLFSQSDARWVVLLPACLSLPGSPFPHHSSRRFQFCHQPPWPLLPT